MIIINQSKNHKMYHPECGIYYGSKHSRIYVPLKEVKVTSKINDIFCKTHITQNYYNDSSDKLSECTYHFHLNETTGSSISENFNIFFSKTGRSVTSVIKEKSVAKRDFSAAKSEGKKTCLFLDNGNGDYEIQIGNIDAGEFVKITFAYNSVMPITKEGYKFIFPTSVAPKYKLSLPFTKSSSDAGGSCNSHGTNANYVFAFSIDWTTGTKIIDVIDNMSNFFDDAGSFTMDTSENKCNVSMTKLPKDGSLSLTLKTDFAPAFYVSPESDGTMCSLASLQIPSEISDNYNKEYIFLLDRSGSMNGERMLSANTGLTMCLKMMNNSKYEKSYFNIIGFGTTCDPMFPKSVPATRNYIDVACDILKYITANLGGTEIMQPIHYIQTLDMPKGTTERIIILLTDGEVTNTDAVVATVGSLKNTRTFTIGIGADVSRVLIEKCATAGNGLSVCVSDVVDLPSYIGDMLKVCANVYYTDVDTTYTDVDGNQIVPINSLKNTKSVYPDKYFQDLSIFAKSDLEKISSVVISGITQDGTYTKKYWKINIEDISTVKQIDQLYQIFVKESLKYDTYTDAEKIDMCIKHTVLCNLVSMIAIDHESTSSAGAGVNVTVSNYAGDLYDSCDSKKGGLIDHRMSASCSAMGSSFAASPSYETGVSFSSFSLSGGSYAARSKMEECDSDESDVGGAGGGMMYPTNTITSLDQKLRNIVPKNFKFGTLVDLTKYKSANPLVMHISSSDGILNPKQALASIGESIENISLLSDPANIVKFYETIANYLTTINPDSVLLNALYFYLSRKVTVTYSCDDDDW